MGKSNRIRNDRYSSAFTEVKTPKKNKGMPSWAVNLITILVTAVILFSVVFMLMVNNGVFGRMSTAMKSENFRVNRNMMNYYFQTQYQNLMSNEEYGFSSAIDTSVSLKEQYLPGYEEDAPEMTWFDYIMGQTEDQVEELLIFCEEAKARGIELDEEELDAIETQLDSFDAMQASYDYIGDVYGKGMKIKDLRAALRLQALAQKCSNQIGKDLEDEISDEDIVTRYDENPKNYQTVDYYNYKLTVNFEDAVIAVLGEDHEHEDIELEENKTKIIDEYNRMIDEAKEKADALTKLESAEEFKKQTLTYVVADAWEAKYEAPDAEEVDLPSEGDLEKIKGLAIDYIVKCIIEKSDSALDFVEDGAIEGFGEVSETYADFITRTVSVIHTNAGTTAGTMTVEGARYSDDDDFVEWAFDGAAVNTGYIVESGDKADGVEMSDDPDELKSFSATVGYITKAVYTDDSISKNVGMMIFDDLEMCLGAADQLSNGMSLEEFEDICDEFGGNFTDYENYTKGSLGNDEFDSWLYDEETVKGSVRTEVIPLGEDNSSYLLAIYYGDGLENWAVSVKADIFNDLYKDVQAEIVEKYKDTIVKKEKSINKIDA